MGVWSTGPFGSDGALDYLGGLADKHATVGPDYTIVPGSVDHGAVLADLTSALAAITEPAKTPEEEYRPATIEYAYAAAGRADEEGVWLGGESCYRRRPTASEWAE